MRPPLASFAHALDFIRMARFYLDAPGFAPANRMWAPETYRALTAVVDDLIAEAVTLEPKRPAIAA